MAIDPVCKMEVDEDEEGLTSVYRGITYYFCCESCKEQFDGDPEASLGREP